MNDQTQTAINALGLASFAVSLELLKGILKSGAVSKETAQGIIDNILLNLENIPLDPLEPALQQARIMVETYGQIAANHSKS